MAAFPPAEGEAPGGTVRVWDLPVRLLHLLLAASVAAAWCLDESHLGGHQAAGWTALAAVALRTAWGAFGSRPARFARFVRGPGATGRYALGVLRGAAPRYLGHNPLGAWMVLALLAAVAATGLTGWLYTLDAFWGLAWLDTLHRGLAWAVLALVAAHVAGVAFTGWRHRENLAAAMLTGTKRRGDTPAADGGDFAP